MKCDLTLVYRTLEEHLVSSDIVIELCEGNWRDDYVHYGPFIIYAQGEKLEKARHVLRTQQSSFPSLNLYCWHADNEEEAMRFCNFFTQNQISCWLVENTDMTNATKQLAKTS